MYKSVHDLKPFPRWNKVKQLSSYKVLTLYREVFSTMPVCADDAAGHPGSDRTTSLPWTSC